MNKYSDKNFTNSVSESYIKNNHEQNQNSKENEEKNEKESRKKYSFHRKNFILKSEICNNVINSNNIYFGKNNSNKTNPITNYYSNYFNIIQNEIEDTNDIKKNIQKTKQNSSIQEFQYIQNNIIYNASEKPNLNNSNSKSNFNPNSKGATINQINNYITNNIIKINNFYPNENDNYLNNHQSNNQKKLQIISLIKDSFGCMLVKNKIMEDPSYANEILFHQIKNDLNDLCCDNFGNYFLQSFLDIITFDNLNIFLNSINNNFTEICMSSYGTRVIQKIIDKISYTPILLNKFTFLLNNKDYKIICNSQYGNHIVQKFISTMHSSEYTNFIYNNIYQNFLEYANNKHGVFIVQKCISEGNEKQRKLIYQLICENLFALIENEFGNYLIQFILLNKKNIEQTFYEILPIIIKIEENIVNFCFSKYSASVIEKCFEKSENLIRNHILDFLFNNHSNRLVDILFNKYGVYIILKATKTQNEKYKNKLIEIINKSDNEIKFIFNSNENNFRNILKIIHKYKELEDIYKTINNIVRYK